MGGDFVRLFVGSLFGMLQELEWLEIHCSGRPRFLPEFRIRINQELFNHLQAGDF